jgi:DNA replication protein DnaC
MTNETASPEPADQPEPRLHRAGDILRNIGFDPDNPYYKPEPLPSPNLDAAATREWHRERALRMHLRRTPPLFRDAFADETGVKSWVGRYLADPSTAGSLLLFGATGTGKTWQAYGALRAIAESGHPPVDWYGERMADLYANLRPGSDNDTERLYAQYAQASLLLIDDLGAAKESEWTEEIACRLVDTRYANCTPTIFTTNLGVGELRGVVGDRIASRLAQMCTSIVMRGPDRRRSS